MNVFFFIILGALLLDYALDLISSLLNLRALRTELPAGLEDIYRPEEYRKSQEYVRVTTSFGLIGGGFLLAVMLAFWLAGGFNYIDSIVRAWGFAPVVTGLFYIGILMLAHSLISLPFSIYGTFVIEERFGFNRTTPGTFVADRLKALGLAALIGGPLLAGVLLLFQYAGPYAWLWCWIAVTVFSLLMQYVAPIWIMPLFNKFTPMAPGELKSAILEFARSVNFPVENVYVMDGSKRSSKGNAFFTGFGRNKRIALFDNLIAQHTVPEMVGVLAHEIGHYKKQHILQATVIGILHTGVLFYLLSLFLNSPGLFQAFFMDKPSIYAGLLFFGLLYTPIEMALAVAMQMFSRKNEYEADRFAAENTGNPGSMIQALKKLSSNNLANLTPHPFYVFIHYSHPPLLERVRALQSYERGKGKKSVRVTSS